MQREAFVKKAILNNEIPSVSNISKALDFSTTIVTDEVLNLCANIKTIELGIPIPNSPNVAPFSQQVSPENSKTKIAGCYYFFSPNNKDLGTYVGHSINLGKRIKDHAKGKESSTGNLVQSAGINVVVRVYIVNPIQLPSYITIQEFILILEQYLFFVLKPTLNIAIVASPGYSNPDLYNTKHIEKVGKNLFIYSFDGFNYFHIYSLTNITALSHIINKNRK